MASTLRPPLEVLLGHEVADEVLRQLSQDGSPVPVEWRFGAEGAL